MFHITPGCLSAIMCRGESCTYSQTWWHKTSVLFSYFEHTLLELELEWHMDYQPLYCLYSICIWCQPPSPPLDIIRVMVIVRKLRGNIIRTAPCWVVWHNVHSQQHTHVSSSYRSIRLRLSHWDPYAMHRGGCLELYYCNTVEWCWWDSSLICKTKWFPSVLWHCWFGYMTCKNRPWWPIMCLVGH